MSTLPLRRVRSATNIAGHPLPPPSVQRRSEGNPRDDLAVSSLAPLSSQPTLDTPPRAQIHQPPLFYGAETPPDTQQQQQEQQQPQPSPPRPQYRGLVACMRFLFLFLYGPRNTATRQLLYLIWTVSFSIVQIAVSIFLLVYAAKHTSPTEAPLTEFISCVKPLGVWNSLWVVKLCFTCIIAGWSWRLDCRIREIRARERPSDVESNSQGIVRLDDPPAATSTSTATRNDSSGSTANGNTQSSTQQPTKGKLFGHLSFLLGLFSTAWFIGAHILLYSSLGTCRYTSPHLWWLTFSILSLFYLTIFHRLLMPLIIVIVCPLIFLLVNLTLGRPLHHPNYSAPKVGKLSKSLVNRIPLVFYIPTPPEDEGKSPITIPPDLHIKGQTHSYPPTKRPFKRRFVFFRKKQRKSISIHGTNIDEKEDGEDIWEDNWEKGDYPFVRLEGNRASCAICLMDFEEPRRVKGGATTPSEEENSRAGTPLAGTEDLVAHESGFHEVVSGDASDANALHLEDAGEGPQPLRLLPCSHVFHKTCIDPWLTDVSGRCPTCQRPVLEESLRKKSKRRN